MKDRQLVRRPVLLQCAAALALALILASFLSDYALHHMPTPWNGLENMPNDRRWWSSIPLTGSILFALLIFSAFGRNRHRLTGVEWALLTLNAALLYFCWARFG